VIYEVGGHDAKYGRKRCDLSHRGVRDLPGPYAFHVILREGTHTHAGNVGVRVELPRPRVPDGLKEVPDPRGEILALLRGDLRSFRWRVLESECGREAHGPSYRQHLLVAGILYAPLAQVRDVGAGHDAARGLVELLARPWGAVRAAVLIEEKLEPLGYVQVMSLQSFISV
jgi:hypothetical protein